MAGLRAARPSSVEVAVDRVAAEGVTPEQAVDETIAQIKEILSE